MLLFFCFSAVQAQNKPEFSFALAADMRNFTGDKMEYFRGACESIKAHKDISIDVGHSRGKGDPGARSTYLIMTVAGDQISYSTYRLSVKTNSYEMADNGILN